MDGEAQPAPVRREARQLDRYSGLTAHDTADEVALLPLGAHTAGELGLGFGDEFVHARRQLVPQSVIADQLRERHDDDAIALERVDHAPLHVRQAPSRAVRRRFYV